MRQGLLSMLKDVPGWLTMHEGQFLEKAARSVEKKSGAVVEIGSFSGKSTIWLALSGSTVHAVDPHKGDVSGGKMSPTLPAFLKNLSRAGVRSLVKPIVKTSREAARTWHRPVKFLFIDGLHDYAHATEDFTLWSPHLVDGGIVAMHDAFCGWQGAGDVAMRHIVYNTAFNDIGVVGSILFGVKGKSSAVSRVRKLKNQLCIELSQGLYRIGWIPHTIKFTLVHRFLRILLVNRFTSLG